jgi:ankyrin repeat protein
MPSSPQKAQSRPAEDLNAAWEDAKQAPTSPAKELPPSPVKEPVRDVKPEELPAACRAGDISTVEAFLNANARGPMGISELAEALFDPYGDSVLHHAVHSSDPKVVQLLLEVGKVQVDIPNARNETALQIACRRGHVDIVAILLAADANPNRRDGNGLTPFLSAVFAGAGEATMNLLMQSKADASMQDDRGISPLHFAALRGDAKLVQWLMQREANADLQTEHGTTPLMLAARRGHADSVSLLLAGNANTLLTDEAGCTALMHALSGSHSDAAKKILETTTSIELVDCAGRSALFHAVLGGRVDAIAAVIQRGGRVNILDEDGRSPLYQACLMGEQTLVQSLLDADADPNLAGRGSTVRGAVPQGDEEDENESNAARACLEESRTCLQVCVSLAHNSLINNILEHGADINAAPGGLGWTALHLCAAVGNEEGAAILLSRGATTSLQDAEGNTAVMLAERAGHQGLLEKLQEAAASEPAADANAAERKTSLRTSLPPLHAHPEPEAPAEEQEPLAFFAVEWEKRESDGSLLDRVAGPMVHDALRSDQWKVRWEALTYLLKRFSDVPGSPSDLVRAVSEIVLIGVKGKIPKVFLAALGIFEELLSDARSDVLSSEEFTALLHGLPLPTDQEGGKQAESSYPDILLALLDETDAGGGDSRAGSTHQAAMDTLCSTVLHGRVPLDEAAWPLLSRIDRRLTDEFTTQDKKELALSAKCLAANVKLLGRWLSTFGLQQSGLFRRAIVLPMLVRGCASEHSKVRSAAIDALIQLVSLSGGIEERIWNLLDSKKRKAVQRHATEQECTSLMSAVACEEDAMQKSVIISEDARADAFTCVSELTPQVWAGLTSGSYECKSPANWKGATEKSASSSKSKSAKAKSSSSAKGAAAAASAAPSREPGAVDEGASEKLQRAFRSKNWKDRAESITALTAELASCGDGLQVVEDASGADAASSGGPLLSKYVLRGHRLCTLQDSLSTLLGDTVTAVFVAAADLFRLTCGHMPLYVAPLFLEPLLPALVGRLLDTSKRTHMKAVETTLEVAALHGCALSEMIVQCVSSGSAWSSSPTTPAVDKSAKSDTERSTGPRLTLLIRLMKQVQENATLSSWTDETWKALADYAMKAAEHRSGDVRKDAAEVLNSMRETGELAAAAANRAIAQLEAMAQQKMGRRPGTGASRLNTGSTRLSTGLSGRPLSNAGLGASGKLSNLGASGRLSTGRVSTASFRPKSGALGKSQEVAEESDNSVHSDDGKEPRVPGIPDSTPEANEAEGEDGIKFMDVTTACPGADETLELADGEAALTEALPLAEALDEVALDFVAPLIALFGDGWTRCFYSRHWQCRVAALMHLSASMPHRLEEINAPEMAPPALGELLDGSMRAVHEGLGDQNVRVYAEACRAVTCVVPAFCGAVDGRLLVAHLAPLLRQLCARMGDSKEVVRTQTTQSLFRLLRPPTGNIVSPVALAMLILRHLMPQKDREDATAEGSGSPPKVNAAASRSAPTGWLCRLAALRDLAKEYHKTMVMQPGASHPGEWLRLKDGLAHGDPTVRHESARLYTLVCKMHLRSLGDEEAQKPCRESWAAALPKELPSKSLSQVRRLLKLPEKPPGTLSMPGSPKRGGGMKPMTWETPAWEIPLPLAEWAGCPPEVLGALKSPLMGDEKAVLTSLRILQKAAANPDAAAMREGAKPDEAFAGICRAIQQVLGNETGADRRIFLSAIDLCQTAITSLSPIVSGLDVNMGLGKTFPVLLDRTSLTADVKIAVASDKLVQQLAKHPKVGCEAVTKMVISAIGRAERPMRPLTLLRTLLGDYGLRLCAQRDVVQLLLGAVATQLERSKSLASDDNEDVEALRTQLVGVLATCNQFSPETVHHAMAEQEASHRKLLVGALQAAPNPRLVALGASAAEQENMEKAGHMAGSAVRAASRGRDSSPKPDSRHISPRSRPPPGPLPAMGEVSGTEKLRREGSSGNLRRSSGRLPTQDGRCPSGSPPLGASRDRSAVEGSPLRVRTHRRQRSENSNSSPVPGGASASNDLGTSLFSEASTTASAEGNSPPQRGEFDDSRGSRHRFPGTGNASSSSSSVKPPAPFELSTALRNGQDKWRFKEGEADYDDQWRQLARAGSSEGRLMKSKENTEGLAALMDVLSQMKDVPRHQTR